jgi:hypothetical protein
MYVNRGLGIDTGEYCSAHGWDPACWPFLIAAKTAQITGTVKTDVSKPLPAPPPAAPAGAPQTYGQMTEPGSWTPEMSAEASMETSRQQWVDFFNRIAAQQPTPPPEVGPCGRWYSFLDPACQAGAGIGTWLILGAAGVLGIVLLSGGRRR